MKREILGIIGGKCNYVEQMPNNGLMTCKYTESQRIVAAQAHEDFAQAESFGFGISGTISSDESEAEFTYTLDGEEVDNPIQEFMNTGVCIISGY